MKDSGATLLGKIPEHWTTRKLYQCLSGQLRNGIFKKKDDFGFGTKLVNVSDLYSEDFYIDYDNLDRVNVQPDEYQSFKVRAGDFFFVRSSLKMEGIARAASILETPEPTVFECHIVKGSPDRNILNPDYLIYYLNGVHARKRLISLANTVTMTTIPQSGLKSLEIFLPPVPEQLAIAAFLDHKTSQIDDLIAKKRRMIELLKEKRTALISHAVTKGLNPDAPMKDSGVPWLGQVPAHWEVKKLKYSSGIVAGFAFDSEAYIDDGVPIIRIGDLDMDGSVNVEKAKRVSPDYLAEGKAPKIRRDNILMAMTGATIGKVSRYGHDAIGLLNQRVCKFVPTNISEHYLWCVLRAEWYLEYIGLVAFGGAQANISDSQLLNCSIPVPPADEQSSIVSFVEIETHKIDTISSKTEQALLKLQEYRMAVISAAVIGQIDVRNWVAHA